MKRSVAAVAVAFVSVALAQASDSKVKFNCGAVRSMIESLEEGPDDVVNQAADDPIAYRDHTIPGWTCTMEPLPPVRNGRIFLQSLDCFTEDGKGLPSDADFAAAGEEFKKGVAAFYECLGNDVVTSAPKTYMRTSRGEGIVAAMKDSYEGRHFVIEYGYMWDSGHHTPIIWQTIVGYGRH